jgi:hypothetical protein
MSIHVDSCQCLSDRCICRMWSSLIVRVELCILSISQLYTVLMLILMLIMILIILTPMLTLISTEHSNQTQTTPTPPTTTHTAAHAITAQITQ